MSTIRYQAKYERVALNLSNNKCHSRGIAADGAKEGSQECNGGGKRGRVQGAGGILNTGTSATAGPDRRIGGKALSRRSLPKLI